MDSVIDYAITPAMPNTICIALHGPLSNYHKVLFDSCIQSFRYIYEPACHFDRQGHDVGYKQAYDSVVRRYHESPEAPVKLLITSKTYDAATRTLQVTFSATPVHEELNGTFRLNAVLTENHVIGWHQHFPQCPGGLNYVNNHIARQLFFHSFGDSLIGGTWAVGQTITRSVSLVVDSGYVAENCEIVAFVDRKADSLFKSNIQQAIRQNLTAGVGIRDAEATGPEIRGIYPNPASGITNISIAAMSNEDISMELVNPSGKVIMRISKHLREAGLYNVELNTAGLPAGIYHCILQHGRVRISRPLVVVH
jgi:hypothetical protein